MTTAGNPVRAGAADLTYPPIENHGAIGNLRTVALVSLDGCVDWLCLPELDSPSVFAALLDARRGGAFRVGPDVVAGRAQRYVGDSNVLETTLDGPEGRLTVTDFMPLAGDLGTLGGSQAPPQLVRVVEGMSGRVEARVTWQPRPGYGVVAPALELVEGGCVALDETGGGTFSLGSLPVEGEIVEAPDGGPCLRASVELRAGERFVLVHAPGEAPVAATSEAALALLEETLAAWRGWVESEEAPAPSEWAGELAPLVTRSALALKLLTHGEHGSVAAAATTSLPEDVGGVRNWDYRYSWLRDAAMTVQSLVATGHRREAVDLLSWAERSSRRRLGADRGRELRIVYRLDGGDDIEERELPHLAGYRRSAPVRVGNGAADQHQPDILGELWSCAHELRRNGVRLDPHLHEFLTWVADRACEAWQEPDDGLWEQRNGPRHYTHSKVMTWLGLSRAVAYAREGRAGGATERWSESREAIAALVSEHAVDRETGAFLQTLSGPRDADAATLLLGIEEFLELDDPRWLATIDLVQRDLETDGLVYRYRADDGLPGPEGAFVLCSFWLVDALALTGRLQEAYEKVELLAAAVNHVGLYAEQVDPHSRIQLGNFPQAFSHIGLVNSALYLAHAEGRSLPIAPPVGTLKHRRGVSAQGAVAPPT